MIAITGTLTSNFSNPTMGTTDHVHQSFMGSSRISVHQTMATARHAYIRDAVDVRMDYWDWLNDWHVMVVYFLKLSAAVQVTTRSVRFYDIRQPKPKSWLRSVLYK